MKKRIFSILLVCCMVLALLPTTAFAAGEIDEQFNLAPGGVYYFDLSGVGIPDTVNDALPDNTLHYVPFTYAGTVDAYKLTSEMATTEEYAETYKYAHSLFVADYAVTYAASWDHLNAIDMIFGKDYTAGGVDYTMRAPSEGSDYTGSGDSERGTPQSNEWDRLLDKDDGYIKNWNGIFSCGQDTVIRLPWRRTVRGHYSSRFCGHRDAAGQNPQVGFRPVLEVLNRDTIGPDGLKTVTLDLGGGKLGDESSIRIIVKNGSEFTAPASDGLTRPEGATGNYFKWLGSDGKLYAPGASVPEDVTTLTARFVPDTYTVIVTTDSLPDGKTGKAYSHTLTAIGAAPITWSIDEGALPAGLRLNEKTGEIRGIPTAAGTATFTVKAENSEGSDTRALSIIISNPVEQTPVRYLDADGKERFCTEYTVLESVIIEDFFDSDNKWYDMPAGWYVVEGDVTITPRLDTHGAVNLILKDDCHLTVPWGINVKEGDTFTIYAQSTAEASMGKLTACLPELSDHEKSVWPVAGLSGIGAGVRVWAANDNYYENEGTIIINGGNIHAKGQQGSSAIGGSDYEHNTSYDGDTPGNLRQGGSITINGGIVCTELRTSGGAHLSDSFGIGTCGGNGGSVTINGGTIIAEASSSAISSGRGGSITINGGNVTAHGGINRYENQPLYAIPGNGIGPLEGGSITINGGTVKASSEGDGFGIGGAGVHHTAEMHITINGGNIETTANRNNAAIGDKSKQKSSVTITGGVIHAVGKGSAAGIGSTGDIRITGGEISVFAEGGGAAIGSIGGVDCKSITINGNAIKSLSSKDGACIGAATGGSVGSITISDAELPLLSSNKILIGWDADSPGGKLTIRNCRVASTDTLSVLTDGIRVGSNSELVIENSEIRLPHFRSIRVGGNGSIAVRDSDLHTYGIFMDETAQSSNDAKTLKKLEITNSIVLTGDIIGARGGYSSVEEIVIHDSSIRLNDEYTYNYCTIGGGTNGSFGSIDIQNSQIHIPSSGGNTAIGNGWQVYYNRESRIRIANSEVSVRCASLGPAIGAAWDSGSGRINIIIENSTVTAKGGNLRTDGNYVPGIGKNALGRAPEIGIQILNSTVDSFRLTEKGGTDYVYDDLHTKELPGIPAENISICGSTVNRKTIDHSFDKYGKCTLCGKYDLGYCYEHGLLTMEGLTDCVSDGSEKKLTRLSHQTGDNETKQLAENTDYTASYSNNVHPYTLTPDDAGFDPEKAPKVTLYGTGNYCGKAEHYFTISENATAAPSITTDTLPNGKVGEAYSQTLSATGTTPITWGIDSGNLPAGLTLDEATGEISGTPTADGTAKFTVTAENSVGSDTKELSITITKDVPAEFTISVKTDGNGTASASPAKAAAGAEITLTATPNTGYHFKEWEVMSGGVTIKDDKFTMPSANVEVKAIFKDMSKEQFTLAPGGTYYFDLSAMGIPGTVNDALPDKTMRYVPFTYAGTVDAYKLMSEMATTEEYAEQNKYDHSLFVADYAVTHAVSWDNLNAEGLIFGKGYAAGSVDYTLRAPSGGSGGTGSGALERGTPQSNEWDRILDKDDGYIKNWRNIGSWGQDTLPNTLSNRVIRGRYDLPRKYAGANTTLSFPFLGFRPVLEVLNPGTLGSDGLKAVTLDLGGGKLGGSSDTIQIIVKTGESFTAPASEGLTRPDGNTGSYFEWLGSDGELYAPDDNVPADVTKLTAQFVPPEQFNLAPDGTYYFDLSGVSIPGTVNGSLPDSTLHYVPFTYAGTVDAYALTSEMATTDEYAQENNYDHSLFIADYNVTHTVSWDDLNTAGLIFDKDYAAGGVDYTLRAPSAGSSSTGPSFSIHGAPQSNEWDRILDKDERYIQNIVGLFSWGQDTPSASASQRVGRGYYPLRGWSSAPASYQTADAGFRPVLEVLGLDKLGYDGLKAVTLDLGGGKLGNSSEDIQIIVKSGESFAAPASDGLTRPDGNTDNYFKWLGSDGELYEPGDNVSADVTKLTAQFAPSSHSVTITTDTLPDGKVGEAYSQTLTATGTTPITWSIDGGNLPADLSLNKDTGEISGTPTADGTAKFTVKAENSVGSDTKELSITITKDAPTEYTITVTNDGNGTASASHAKAAAGTEITLTATPNEGYHFKEWLVESPTGLVITNNKFTMPDSDVEVKAVFEEDAPPAPTDPAKPSISVTGTYTYNGSEHTATVSGYDPATMDISGNTATDAGDYTVRVTSKTGKWADGSTDAVTAAWSIGKATQEAPNGLIGVAPTTEGGSDGKITGVDATMEYRAESETIYTACTGIEIENLSAGNYFVRYAEDHNHFASPDAEVTVGEGKPLADFTITFNGNGGSGSMEPVTVKAETNYILPACGFTAPADQEFKAWEIGGTEYKVGDSYTVLGDTEIKALWENSVITPTTYTVTVSNDGNGTASASPAKAAAGAEITLTAKPNEGYHFKEWQVVSPAGLVITNNKFTMPDSNVEVTAIFEKDAPPAPTEFIVTFDGNGGTSSVGSMTTTNQKLTSLPSASRRGSYSFDGWYTEKSGGTKITTDTVFHANTTVYAHWTYIGGYTPPVRPRPAEDVPAKHPGFVDAPASSYFYEAVMWAVERGITTGVSANRFDPNGVCTRAQAVTFLWRAAGSPAPRSRTMPFTDVPVGSYYYDAVLWAVENGITMGTSDTTFSPNMTCSRAQIVAFLWRSEKSPAAGSRNPFADVKSTAYYADAVLWAVREDITKGTTSTTFSPDADCTRAQIVTFLWRCKK